MNANTDARLNELEHCLRDLTHRIERMEKPRAETDKKWQAELAKTDAGLEAVAKRVEASEAARTGSGMALPVERAPYKSEAKPKKP